MNYRHAFHAGNFADLVKHAAILMILDRMMASPEPMLVVDTHAGAGLYDLGGEMARKSGEADAGVGRLMADAEAPEALASLKAAVRKANPSGGLRFYPGSPMLVADRLRKGDDYVGAELRADDAAALTEALAGSRARARGVLADGFDLLAQRAADPRRLFAVIDPPFERADDYDRILESFPALMERGRPTTALIWLPLKDLETLDSFVRGLEDLEPGNALVIEARLNRLHDPMKMNGCALVLLNPPPELEAPLKAAADWVVRSAGGDGAVAKLWRLSAG